MYLLVANHAEDLCKWQKMSYSVLVVSMVQSHQFLAPQTSYRNKCEL